MIKFVYLSVIIFLATSAFAHKGVKDQAVKARMQAMKEMAANMKAIREISKAMHVSDKAKARTIIGQIAVLASQAPELFKGGETDPNSKAKPEIWQNFEDFLVKAKNLEQVSLGLSNTISNAQDVKQAITKIGKACKSCHELYKLPKK